ncbi:MAG: PQQ-binding-like beta-propeller repeat protein [Pirellulales bacterium]
MNGRFRVVSLGFASVLLVESLVSFVAAAGPDPMDWPNWRGPRQDRVSTEKGLPESWDPDGGQGSNLLWIREDLGGRSSPVVFQDRLYTIVRDKPATEEESEKVVCVDAATGKTIWEHSFNMYLTDVPDERIGWSCPVVDPETGDVYIQGVSGYFCCLDGKTGKVKWERSLHEEFGLISTYGGRTNVPVVFEDTVLISAVVVGWGDAPKWGGLARPAHRFMSFDKKTGELRWLNGTGISPFDTTYSTPTVTMIDGQAALVFASGDGEVWALQPRTGKPLWHYPMSGSGMNVSPLVAPDGTVYISHSEENRVGSSMGAVVALDGKKSGDLTGTELWQELQVMAGKSSPVILDDRVYFVDDRAKLYIYNAKTGEFIARKALGTSMRSTPLVADGKLYLCTMEGRWYVLKPTKTGVKVIQQLRLPNDQSDGSLAVSHGRLFLPTSRALYCIADPSVKPSADPLPPEPKESTPDGKAGPAQLQVIPYDALLKPGGEQSYHVKLFDSRGREIKAKLAPDALKYAVDGPGSITSDGTYIAPKDAKQATALVTCKLGDLTGTARVRITPPLPWKFDFNDGDVPLTWIGGRVRFEPRESGGEKYIAKKTVLPTPKDPNNKLGTRSFVWMGPIDLSNYTIQGDVLLKKDEASGKISDIGLIDGRYQLTIRGLSKKLRLDSWTTSDYRKHTSVDFDPVPDTWYTMKLRVEPGEKEAKVMGKIWKRGDAEPQDWTVEMVDQSPNLHGTPGLYGNCPEAEIFVDNVIVTPNN